ncbi:MAG: hypothetical protein NTZ26_05330 [Candidatus Aminicenantes bacterium]|nr:hypothetical protein [Candidatus Aminicenantes bacterium]
MRIRRGVALALLLGAAAVLRLLAAVGCELNDPDRDVKRLFPGATSFKTEYVSLQRAGGEALLRRVEAKLGDKFQGLYETIDVSYTMYRIYKGTDLVGYIHGVNQKGRYGGIQVFLALDLKGVIQAFYFQKLTNQAAGQLRDPAFGKQFVGLTLADFEAYDPAVGAVKPGTRLAAVKNPAPSAEDDFKAALRGAKKNLILCDVFLLGGANVK